MKVAKFGGSSVSTAEQIKKVLTIVNKILNVKSLSFQLQEKGIMTTLKLLIY